MSALSPNAAAAKANPNAISVRIKSRDAKGAANQRSHDLRIGRQPQYVDELRSKLNRHILKALTASEISQICEDRRLAAGLERKRAVASNAAIATVGIITFGVEAQKAMAEMDAVTQDRLFREVADRIAARLGTSVTGLSVHVDESALHAHFQMPAVSVYGAPVSKIAVKKVLNEVQTIAAQVAGAYDKRIERGRPRVEREAAGEKRADTINRQVRTLHDDLPREIAALVAKIEVEQARLEKNLRLAAAAEQKAIENENRAEKARKNAETYERRATDARAELESLSAEYSRLQALQAEITVAEQRLEPLRLAMEALDEHAAQIETQKKADFQQEAEEEAAQVMFGSEPEFAAMAILAASDEVFWEYSGKRNGGWILAPVFEEEGLKMPPAGKMDFRGIVGAFRQASQSVFHRIKNQLFNEKDFGDEYSEIVTDIAKIANRIKTAGRWSRDFFIRCSGMSRELLPKAFDRLVDDIKTERLEALEKQAPPVVAAPFVELPENAKAAVRKALLPKGPTGP